MTKVYIDTSCGSALERHALFLTEFFNSTVDRAVYIGSTCLRSKSAAWLLAPAVRQGRISGGQRMNNIIYIIGAIVVVIVVLKLLGLY